MKKVLLLPLFFIFLNCNDSSTSPKSLPDEINENPSAFESWGPVYPIIEIDEASFTYAATYLTCNNGVFKIDTAQSETYRYHFEKNILVLRSDDDPEDDCYLEGGREGNLSGNWIGIDGNCKRKNYTLQYLLTENTFREGEIISNYCWSERYKNLKMPDDFSLKTINCNSLELTENKKNNIEIILKSLAYEQISMQINYQGKTCEYKKANPEIALNSSRCQNAWNAYEQSGSDEWFDWMDWYSNSDQEAFENCIHDWDISENETKVLKSVLKSFFK